MEFNLDKAVSVETGTTTSVPVPGGSDVDGGAGDDKPSHQQRGDYHENGNDRMSPSSFAPPVMINISSQPLPSVQIATATATTEEEQRQRQSQFGEDEGSGGDANVNANQVIITDPPEPREGPGNVDLFYNGVGETPESISIVETALLGAARLGGVSGFNVGYKWLPCFPSLKIQPAMVPMLIGLPAAWMIKGRSVPGCYCCFPCAPTSCCSSGGRRGMDYHDGGGGDGHRWQNISLKWDGVRNGTENANDDDGEILSFIYKPELWWSKTSWPDWMGMGGNAPVVRSKIADIYIPQRNKRLGFIKYGDRFEDKAVIVDCVSRSAFVAFKVDSVSDNVIAMKITNQFGIPVAIAQATRGWRQRGFVTWTEFSLKFIPVAGGGGDTLLKQGSARAVVLVAFMLWVLTYRERTLRHRFVPTCIFVLIMIFIGFSAGYWGG